MLASWRASVLVWKPTCMAVRVNVRRGTQIKVPKCAFVFEPARPKNPHDAKKTGSETNAHGGTWEICCCRLRVSHHLPLLFWLKILLTNLLSHPSLSRLCAPPLPPRSMLSSTVDKSEKTSGGGFSSSSNNDENSSSPGSGNTGKPAPTRATSCPPHPPPHSPPLLPQAAPAPPRPSPARRTPPSRARSASPGP